MNDDFVRLPTQDGDTYVRASSVRAVEDNGSRCFVYVDMFTTQKVISVTINAATVIALLRGEQSPEPAPLPKVG